MRSTKASGAGLGDFRFFSAAGSTGSRRVRPPDVPLLDDGTILKPVAFAQTGGEVAFGWRSRTSVLRRRMPDARPAERAARIRVHRAEQRVTFKGRRARAARNVRWRGKRTASKETDPSLPNDVETIQGDHDPPLEQADKRQLHDLAGCRAARRLRRRLQHRSDLRDVDDVECERALAHGLDAPIAVLVAERQEGVRLTHLCPWQRSTEEAVGVDADVLLLLLRAQRVDVTKRVDGALVAGRR